MSETISPEAFFADVLLPLRRANERRGVHYLATAPDPSADTYWQPVASRTGGLRLLSVAEGSGEMLLEALGAYWSERDEEMLTRLLPELEILRQELYEPRIPGEEQDATLSVSVYPLF